MYKSCKKLRCGPKCSVCPAYRLQLYVTRNETSVQFKCSYDYYNSCHYCSMTSHAFTKRQGTLLTTPSLFSQQYHLNLADGEKKKAQRSWRIWLRSHIQEVTKQGFEPRSVHPRNRVAGCTLLWHLFSRSFSGKSTSSTSPVWGQMIVKLTKVGPEISTED